MSRCRWRDLQAAPIGWRACRATKPPGAFLVLSCLVLSCLVPGAFLVSLGVIRCSELIAAAVLQNDDQFWSTIRFDLSAPIMTRFVARLVSCLVLSCLVLSCLVLSCLGSLAWHIYIYIYIYIYNSTWEAKAGDAILVDGRTWYNQDLLGQSSGAILAFEFRSKKEKNETVQAVGRRLQNSGALRAAGVPAQVLGLEGQVRAQPESFIGGVFRRIFLMKVWCSSRQAQANCIGS
eukprot:COSAG06_NODE_1700_length_8675_cov_3.485774_6_plen_234_part_00